MPGWVQCARCTARCLGIGLDVGAQAVSERALGPRGAHIIGVLSSGVWVDPQLGVSEQPQRATFLSWWAGRVLRCGSGIPILEGLWAWSVRTQV